MRGLGVTARGTTARDLPFRVIRGIRGFFISAALRTSHCLRQMLPQRPERLPSMAHGQLLVRRYLCERPAVRWIEEDRIVTETVCAARLARDVALHGAFVSNITCPSRTSVSAQTKRAALSTAPRRSSSANRSCELLGVRVAIVSGRVDSGRAVEGVDCEARVLRDGRQPGRARIVQRLHAAHSRQRSSPSRPPPGRRDDPRASRARCRVVRESPGSRPILPGLVVATSRRVT